MVGTGMESTKSSFASGDISASDDTLNDGTDAGGPVSCNVGVMPSDSGDVGGGIMISPSLCNPVGVIVNERRLCMGTPCGMLMELVSCCDAVGAGAVSSLTGSITSSAIKGTSSCVSVSVCIIRGILYFRAGTDGIVRFDVTEGLNALTLESPQTTLFLRDGVVVTTLPLRPGNGTCNDMLHLRDACGTSIVVLFLRALVDDVG